MSAAARWPALGHAGERRRLGSARARRGAPRGRGRARRHRPRLQPLPRRLRALPPQRRAPAARSGSGRSCSRRSRVALRAAALTGGIVDPTVGARADPRRLRPGLRADRRLRRPGSPPPAVAGWRAVSVDRARRHACGSRAACGSTSAPRRRRSPPTGRPRRPRGRRGRGRAGQPRRRHRRRRARRPPAAGRSGSPTTIARRPARPGQTLTPRLRRPGDLEHDRPPLGRRARTTSSIPRTGRPAVSPWRTVSVAAATCVDANTASTAAIVLGDDAPAWLAARGLPARLVDHDGRPQRGRRLAARSARRHDRAPRPLGALVRDARHRRDDAACC